MIRGCAVRGPGWLLVAIAGAPAAAQAPGAAVAEAPAPDPPAFAMLKRLAGTWQIADAPASTLRIRFSLTAGGTVLVESWARAGRPHSLTLYHRDGQTLVATHYCPQGNQPRLALVPGGADGSVAFRFRDATDLDAAHESYLTSLRLALLPGDVLERAETYRHGATDEPSTLRLVRAP